MAAKNTESVALELPGGTLLVGTTEKDGETIETKAFPVGPGVVTVCSSGDTVKSIRFHYGARIENVLDDGEVTRGILAKGGK